jgi:hypothetical protein
MSAGQGLYFQPRYYWYSKGTSPIQDTPVSASSQRHLVIQGIRRPQAHVEVYGLDLGVVLERSLAALTTDPRLFVACDGNTEISALCNQELLGRSDRNQVGNHKLTTKWNRPVHKVKHVHPRRAGLQRIGDPHGALIVFSVDARSEAI